MLKWFKSYLSNRKQYVYLNGESSEIKEIACGYCRVLFWVHYFFYYTLMIFLTSLKYWTFIYLLMIPTYIMKAITLKNWKKRLKELGKLQLWLNVNRLSLNRSKTYFVIFHPFNKPLKYQITLKIQKTAIS